MRSHCHAPAHPLSLVLCFRVLRSGRIQGFNLKLLDKLGYLPEELLGHPAKTLMSVEQERTHGSQRRSHTAALRQQQRMFSTDRHRGTQRVGGGRGRE